MESPTYNEFGTWGEICQFWGRGRSRYENFEFITQNFNSASEPNFWLGFQGHLSPKPCLGSQRKHELRYGQFNIKLPIEKICFHWKNWAKVPFRLKSELGKSDCGHSRTKLSSKVRDTLAVLEYPRKPSNNPATGFRDSLGFPRKGILAKIEPIWRQ